MKIERSETKRFCLGRRERRTTYTEETTGFNPMSTQRATHRPMAHIRNRHMTAD